MKTTPPLQELVKGSYDYAIYKLRRAFFDQFPAEPDRFLFPVEYFDDRVVVEDSKLEVDEFWSVPYVTADAAIVFAPVESWSRVQLGYTSPSPLPMSENRQASGTVFLEQKSGALLEAPKSDAENGSSAPRKIIAEIARANLINGNGRRYSESVMRQAVSAAQRVLRGLASERIPEILGQSQYILGEDQHPSSRGAMPRLTETVLVWDDFWLRPATSSAPATLMGSARIVNTNVGKDVLAVVEAGIKPKVSLRAFGESKLIEESGQPIEEVIWFEIVGVDLVINPSFTGAGVTHIESLQENKMPPKNEEEAIQGAQDAGAQKTEKVTQAAQPQLKAETIFTAHPELAEQVHALVAGQRELEQEKQRRHDEAERKRIEAVAAEREKALRETLGLSETEDLTVAVAERQRQFEELEKSQRLAQVAGYIAQETSQENLNYPEFLAKQLREAVNARAPQTLEEAKQVIREQRKIFDGVKAGIILAARGRGVDVLGPTLESDANVPAFARAAFEISETLRRSNRAQSRPINQLDVGRMTPAELFTSKYLEKFDERYKGKLLAEARAFEEAEAVSDLSLPYSVARAIVQEAYPRLVALNVFDVGMADGQVTTIYYESRYAAESGTSVSVTGSSNVNVATLDTWFQVQNGGIDVGHIQFSGFALEPSGGGTPFVYGTDYVVNFLEGQVMLLSTGAMAASTNYDFDFTYRAIRKGENQAIERAKATLASTTLTQKADRLATEITREAIVFSRAHLGWDATVETLALLIKEIQQEIDENLLTTALSQALTVASNSGGAWNSSSDTLTALVTTLVAARTNIENRHYAPTAMVLSKTHGNKLLMWDGFTAAGTRPGFVLNDAPGFIGEVAGIPIFTTTQFPDSYGLVFDRQIIHWRVFQPMQLRGPYPSYSSNKLLPNEQYYVEEFNGLVSPIAGKASYITIS